jgi:hypothetical protein
MGPIPEEFYSFETGKAFDRCTECAALLRDDNSHYYIEKAIRGSEVLLEMALCSECLNNLIQSFSSETRERLHDFFHGRVKFGERGNRLLKEAGTSVSPWIASCVFCGTPRSEAGEHWVVGECVGDCMKFYWYPYIICEDCTLEKRELMSAKSRGASEDWGERTFDGPPSLDQLLPQDTGVAQLS